MVCGFALFVCCWFGLVCLLLDLWDFAGNLGVFCVIDPLRFGFDCLHFMFAFLRFSFGDYWLL